MYWKMSIDLSRPLVPSMGHHDPLDGFITYSELQATFVNDWRRSPELDLTEEINDIAGMCRGKSWPRMIPSASAGSCLTPTGRPR